MGVLGALGGVLRTSWGVLGHVGASWVVSGASWGRLGSSWERLGGVLAAFWLEKPPNINLTDKEREAPFLFLFLGGSGAALGVS